MSEARIYLSDRRGITQSSLYRSYHTFNFGEYADKSREAFGALNVLNDNTLGPGQKMVTVLEENTLLMILPIVGGVKYNSDFGTGKALESGEACLVSFPQRSPMEITNPYNDLINYLHVEFQLSNQQGVCTEYLHAFDLNANRNRLITFGWHNEKHPWEISIGKFDGRGDGNHYVKNYSHGVFAFILEGAFEVQGRLLHARDGLALRSTSEVEFEALSNEAIILFLSA